MTTPALNLDPATTALINVHWQKDIVAHDGAFAPFFAAQVAKHSVVDVVRRLTDDVRAVDSLVVWARAAFRDGYPELPLNNGLNRTIRELGALIDGSPGARIIPELQPIEAEPVVSHPGTSAFHDTALDAMLRLAGVETVALTGVSTNITVEGTARDAVNLGYQVVLVADACTADSDAAHKATLSTFGLLGSACTAAELIAALSLNRAGA